MADAAPVLVIEDDEGTQGATFCFTLNAREPA
jgi:hypothetical protein